MARRTNSKSQTTKNEPIILEGNDVKIEIREWTNKEGSTVRFATVTFFECITVYQCRIMQNKDGRNFLAMPQYKDKDGKYWNYCYVEKEDEISKEIDTLLNEEPLPFN